MSKKFKAQDHFRYKKLGTSWRKPKGRQSKMREKRGSKSRIVDIGYGTDKSIKHKMNGVCYVHVYNVAQLQNIEKSSAVVIAAGVGLLNVIAIADKAHELGIRVINMGKVKQAKKKIIVNKKLKEQRIADAKKKEEKKKDDKKDGHKEHKEEKAEHKEEHKEAKADHKEAQADHKEAVADHKAAIADHKTVENKSAEKKETIKKETVKKAPQKQ